jgi:Leucine-rich repeat (LRR) protein
MSDSDDNLSPAVTRIIKKDNKKDSNKIIIPTSSEFIQITIYIILCNKSIFEIPPEIKSLKNLEIIDLSNNEIKEFPNDILKYLYKLEILNLSNNKITSITEKINFLTIQN